MHIEEKIDFYIHYFVICNLYHMVRITLKPFKNCYISNLISFFALN